MVANCRWKTFRSDNKLPITLQKYKIRRHCFYIFLIWLNFLFLVVGSFWEFQFLCLHSMQVMYIVMHPIVIKRRFTFHFLWCRNLPCKWFWRLLNKSIHISCLMMACMRKPLSSDNWYSLSWSIVFTSA